MESQEQINLLESMLEQQMALNARLLEEIEFLRSRVTELEARLSQNSSNSSKPPSSDLYKPNQTTSLRVKGIKKPGSQPGHKGDTLRFSDRPDILEEHSPGWCRGCGLDLSGVGSSGYESRQVYDLPPLSIQVTEHRCHTKCCPACGGKTSASFPEGITRPTQYGLGIKALGTYLTQYQLLPYGRTAELFGDMFSHRVSVSFLCGNNADCAGKLGTFMTELKEKLSARAVLHADETGYYVCGERGWLHLLSTESHSCYMPHAKRGTAAMDAMGVLADYNGVLVHDFWKPYFRFGCAQALCNAHLLRELNYSGESLGSSWAVQTSELMVALHGRVGELKEKGLDAMGEKEMDEWIGRYDKLMEYGLHLHPPPDPDSKKTGKPKQSKTRNLLERFVHYSDGILRFMRNFAVPFTNNNAEQAVRMMKVKQKVSGCFRSESGAADFATTRSYIASMKKQGQNIMDALMAAFDNKAFQTVA